MRIVIDEGVPRQIVQALRDHGLDAARFPRAWAALGNGALLQTIEEAGFSVLITNDKNMATSRACGVERLRSWRCLTTSDG